jgi:hypothetical protein
MLEQQISKAEKIRDELLRLKRICPKLFIDEPIDSSSDEPDAPVRTPLKPKPNLRSGGVALPEPEPENSRTRAGILK